MTGLHPEISIRRADSSDVRFVREILLEAEHWLEAKGEPLWHEDEVSTDSIANDVDAGLFYLAECDGVPVGTVRFQLTDELFWPDIHQDESAFIHRLAVRRNYAGGKVSTALLRWSVNRAANLGRRYLRLDCEASRPKLKDLYERFGFQWHSDRQVGPYYVSRYEFSIEPLSQER